MPARTIDHSTTEAKAKRVDAGRQFLWIIGKTVYTVFYTPPFTPDGKPQPNVLADMESGTRKAIMNSSANLISEKPFKVGTISGTEFRYTAAGTVNYISRVFIIGENGYQVMGSYSHAKDEAEIMSVLNSFRPVHKR